MSSQRKRVNELQAASASGEPNLKTTVDLSVHKRFSAEIVEKAGQQRTTDLLPLLVDVDLEKYFRGFFRCVSHLWRDTCSLYKPSRDHTFKTPAWLCETLNLKRLLSVFQRRIVLLFNYQNERRQIHLFRLLLLFFDDISGCALRTSSPFFVHYCNF